MRFDPNSIPGFTEAVARERQLRNVSFLPICLNISDFEVRQLTLRDWLILYSTESPMVFGGIPTPGQVAQFLWLLNPRYNREGRGKSQFLRMCRRAFKRPLWVRDIVAGIRKYMADTMVDLDGRGAPEISPSYYCDATYLCALLGHHLHYSEAAVLSMPIARVLQYKKAIRDLVGSGIPQSNPSDKIIGEWLQRRNEEGRKN